MTVPAFTVLNFGVRYSFNTVGRSPLKHTIGLNVNNVTDEFYIQPNRQAADGINSFVSYSVRF